jgi:hypothetical protein
MFHVKHPPIPSPRTASDQGTRLSPACTGSHNPSQHLPSAHGGGGVVAVLSDRPNTSSHHRKTLAGVGNAHVTGHGKMDLPPSNLRTMCLIPGMEAHPWPLRALHSDSRPGSPAAGPKSSRSTMYGPEPGPSWWDAQLSPGNPGPVGGCRGRALDATGNDADAQGAGLEPHLGVLTLRLNWNGATRLRTDRHSYPKLARLRRPHPRSACRFWSDPPVAQPLAGRGRAISWESLRG